MITILCAVLASVLGQAPDSRPASPPPAGPGGRLTLITFNIRLGTVDDGPNHWRLRRDMVFGLLREHSPDLAGMQEVVRFQLDEILHAVPEYEALGVGREDGKTRGEYSPILYRKDRLRLLEQGTFWLSETPEEPGSRSWKTACTRVCTWGRFEDRQTAGRFYLFNTHLDHVSQEAREEGVALIARRMKERNHPEPVFLTGDFNAGEENPAVRFVKGQGEAAGSPRLVDTFRAVHPDARDAGTFNGWKGQTMGAKIDYIFAPADTRVLDARILHDNRDGRYPSDHFPVKAVVAPFPR
jgi:endonuclease/exonuclease/phosphatase family metal-dependent hydrolase